MRVVLQDFGKQLFVWTFCDCLVDFWYVKHPNKPSTVPFSYFPSGLDRGGVPADTTPGHAPVPAPTGDPEAGHTVGTTGGGTVTAIPPCLLGDVTLGTGYVCEGWVMVLDASWNQSLCPEKHEGDLWKASAPLGLMYYCLLAGDPNLNHTFVVLEALTVTTWEIHCTANKPKLILISVSFPLGKSWSKLLSRSVWAESVHYRTRSARGFLQVWAHCRRFHRVRPAVAALPRVRLRLLRERRGCQGSRLGYTVWAMFAGLWAPGVCVLSQDIARGNS